MTTNPVMFHPKRNPFDAWKEKGSELARDFKNTDAALENSQWLVGDWLLEGEDQFGDKAYPEAEKITGWGRDYLYNVVWVVNRFRDVSLRKETKLKWSHFKELARVKDKEVRLELLERVNDGFDHPVVELRQIVDRQLNRNPSPEKQRSKGLAYLRVALKPKNCDCVKLLAKARKKTPDELLGLIVAAYLKDNKSEISAELNKAQESRRKLRKERVRR